MKDTCFTCLGHDFTLDKIAPDGRIGLISLATDFTIEQEIRLMLPETIGLYVNRVRNANPLTLENLRAMEKGLGGAAADILPGLGVDVMIYACTAGSAAIGSDRIEAILQEVCPGVTVTNPVVATRAALKALGAERISILTPYSDALNHTLVPAIEADGAEVINIAGFGMEDDIDVAGVPLERIIAGAKAACDPDADAVFLSCTALRGARVVERLEDELGKPVLSSNQVLAWHAMRLLGVTVDAPGFGRLFAQN